MLNIEEASKQISRSLQDRYLDLKNELNTVNELIAATAKEFKEAAAAGDVRENAAYSEAEDKLTKLNTQKLYLLQEIESIESVTTDLRYVPKSYIDIYSTFRLKREDTEEISTWRVYPGSISDVERGIMSSQSPIYKTLEGKEKGDTIITNNRISGKSLKFTVLEVY
jgi:transcription elongation factor GreA